MKVPRFPSWPIAIAATAVVAGLLARAPQMPGLPPGTRVFPRIPAPPSDPQVMLWQVGVGSVVWYAAAIAFPLMLVGAARLEPGRTARWRLAGALTLGVVVLAFATTLIEFLVRYPGGVRPPMSAYMAAMLPSHLLPWIAVVGVVAALENRRRVRAAALDQERLRAEVAEQRLLALTGQLQPHFLFNTLQGIATLIHRDPDAAEEMLAMLGDLLRDLLRRRDQVVISVEDELAYARTFLALSQFRFGDRLRYTIDVDEDARQAMVPLFVLQPLIENALAHGIGDRIAGGVVRVEARAKGDRLLLEVTDDGNTPAGGNTAGVGLRNTRARLETMYPADHRFDLLHEEGGTTARITIPLRPAKRA